MVPTILITRPDPSGAAFADQVRRRFGDTVQIVLSPVLKIERCGSLPDLSRFRTLIFTSRHGVEAFAALSDRRDLPAYAVGDATARSARDAGMSVVACGGDAPSLVARILADEVQGPCLHIHGEHAAGNISGDLTLAGIETHEAILYRQAAVDLNDMAKAALQRGTPVIVPLFSPRSARLFCQGLKARAPLWAVAISENARAEIPAGLVRDVVIAGHPSAPAMLDAMQGPIDAAKRLEGGNAAK
ncbi:uroporphyrinogen-III synthase [uncultured Roseovarius sp.]|uniref:uroporphyrinogen-III synthase n=1 Tax=uncultured Roseovarius sp. TaxID=293344 RepID=UPI0025918983|nr:uroporphyrinogen-III synthase [uncultured Roseovarius sp.]